MARERNQELKVRASARKKLDDEERAIQRKVNVILYTYFYFLKKVNEQMNGKQNIKKNVINELII